ncbi:MAG: helicase HerA domain-containing protein [Candidatus Levyibacteriota bacterium]
MKKQLDAHHTNGYSNGSRGNKSKLSLPEIEAFISEAQEVLADSKKKKGRKSTNQADLQPPKSGLLQQIQDFRLQRMTKNHQEEKGKRKSLEKAVKQRDDTLTAKEKEITELQHIVATQKKTIAKTFPTSELLQLVKPVLRKSSNPLDSLKNYLRFRKEIKEYNKQVALVAKTKEYPTRAIKEEEITLAGTQKDYYSADALSIFDKTIHIGERWVRLYYLAGLPPTVKPSVMFTLLSNPLPINMSLFVQPIPNNEILKSTRKRITVLSTIQDQRERRSLIRDPEMDKYISENEELADNITHEREKGFFYALYCELEAKTQEELILFDKELRNIVEAKEITFNTYSFGQKEALQNFMPFAVDSLNESKILSSSAVSLLLPFTTKQLYNPRGVFIGTNVYHNSVVFLNFFTEMNSNINIFGVAGAGKSVTSKILASRLYMKGTQIIIIDPEGEYVKLAGQLGGEVVQFSRSNGMNPFSIYSSLENVENDILDHIGVLKSFFKFFIREDRYDATILDKVLIDLYKPYPKVRPTFQNFLKKLEGTAMYEDIAILETGSLKGVFNAEREIKLGSDFVVFDISALKETEMKEPAMYLLTSLIWQLVDKNREQRKMLFIDEAHNLLVDRQVALFYRKLVKEARKRNVGVVSITQNVEDFLNDECGIAIITNSLTKIMLRQSYATLQHIDKIKPMSDEQKQELAELRNGEVVILKRNEFIGAYVHVFPSERALVFTQAAENDENS